MQMKEAKKGKATQEMKKISEVEDISLKKIIRRVSNGKIVIPKNNKRKNTKTAGIGKGLKTKINANIGTSPDYKKIDKEIKKAKIAVEYGADFIMDLSIGGDLKKIRKKIMNSTNVPIGTVPIYQTGIEKCDGDVLSMNSDDIFDCIRKHGEEGVDFITVHCGITLETVRSLQKSDRLMNLVSRGGSFLAAWMLHNDKENPLFEEFDYLLDIVSDYDITLSLGDGLRPGCLADSSDFSQFRELFELGKLLERARDADIQTMIEGPGHLPLDEIKLNVELEKKICDDAPFYVLGPIVTDIAPGYDHLVGAIGGSVAAMNGADFLCYVTPSEHLCLPNEEDVKKGVIASKIAAHVADVAKGISEKEDKKMSIARKNLDWEKQYNLAINSEKARKLRENRPSNLDSKACSMCSDHCALKIAENYLKNKEKDN